MMQRHAKGRGADRYGLSLNNEDMRGMVQQIHAGKGRFVGRESNRVTVWIVEHSGRHLPAVYDSNRQVIVTFLPPSAACMESYRSEWNVAGPPGVDDGNYCEGAGE